MRALVAVLGFLLGLAAGATFDQALTNSARGGVGEEHLYLTFRGIPAPRRSSPHQHHHTLLSLAFPGNSRFAVVLDRAQGQVVLESVLGGVSEKRRLEAPPRVKAGGTLDSLVVEVQQGAEARAVTVYGDCHLLGTLSLGTVPKDMMEGQDLQEIRLYRDRHVDVSLDWDTSLLQLLEKLGCPEAIQPEVQAQSNEIYTYRRGDIPIMHDDQSTTKLVTTISELIDTIKELQIEIQTQREETTLLRDALINCEACKVTSGRQGFSGR